MLKKNRNLCWRGKLHKVTVNAGLKASPNVLAQTGGGEHDHREPLELLLGSYPSHKFKSAHHWHAEVSEHETREFSPRCSVCGLFQVCDCVHALLNFRTGKCVPLFRSNRPRRNRSSSESSIASMNAGVAEFMAAEKPNTDFLFGIVSTFEAAQLVVGKQRNLNAYTQRNQPIRQLAYFAVPANRNSPVIGPRLTFRTSFVRVVE